MFRVRPTKSVLTKPTRDHRNKFAFAADWFSGSEVQAAWFEWGYDQNEDTITMRSCFLNNGFFACHSPGSRQVSNPGSRTQPTISQVGPEEGHVLFFKCSWVCSEEESWVLGNADAFLWICLSCSQKRRDSHKPPENFLSVWMFFLWMLKSSRLRHISL